MDLSYGPEIEEFRQDVRAFLRDNWRPDPADPAGMRAYIATFRQSATKAGYLYRAIPREWGGSEQPSDVMRAQVIREEFSRARAPMEVRGNGMNMLVPTLLEKGTDKQKQMFIRPTMAGEMVWGQGYSEPSTGSDLASVRTRAELVGDKWIVNGQKIWTSQGDKATHMFMLVRTEPEASKHGGISYLLMDLDQAGVTRRPIRQLTGESGFYEFFFDDAETPVDMIVGERGEGWSVSRTTLKHERASIGSADGLGTQFAKLVELAGETGRLSDPLVRDRLAAIEGWVLAHRASSYRLFSCAAHGEPAGIIQLMMKLLLTEIGHDMAVLSQDLLGEMGQIEPEPAGTRRRGPEKWLDQVMGSLGNSIAGGTTNIQRNIVGERGLDLPRDPGMAG